jgi:hypothetical protein
VFEVLSLFAGGFDLGDATRLVVGIPELTALREEAQAADVVLGLVDRSMLAVAHDDHIGSHSRYTMLETLRAYGRQRLDERGHLKSARRAHAQLVVNITGTAAARLYGPGHAEASARIGTYLDELRSAHAWALAHDLPLCVRLVGSLALYVEHRIPVEVRSGPSAPSRPSTRPTHLRDWRWSTQWQPPAPGSPGTCTVRQTWPDAGWS